MTKYRLPPNEQELKTMRSEAYQTWSDKRWKSEESTFTHAVIAVCVAGLIIAICYASGLKAAMAIGSVLGLLFALIGTTWMVCAFYEYKRYIEERESLWGIRKEVVT